MGDLNLGSFGFLHSCKKRNRQYGNPVIVLVVGVIVITAATVIAVVAVVWVDIPAPQVHLKDYPLKYIQLRISGFFSFFNCGG